jgi:hypothetical protein
MNLFFLLALLVVFACSYLIYFGLIAKPEWSIYAYILVWLTVPKAFRLFYISGGAYDLPEGLTVFHIVEAVAVCGIVVALVRHHGLRFSEKTETLRRFAWFFLITGIVSFAVSFGFLSIIFSSQLDDLWTYLEWNTELQNRILPFAAIVFGVIFLYGCIAFITERKHVETILLLFLLLGIGMGLECLAFYYLASIYTIPILTPLARWSAQQGEGRFMSLVFSSFDQVGLFSIVAVSCCLYFSLTRKNKLILLLLPLLFLPILAGYQRSVLMGTVVSLVFVYWHASANKNRFAYVSMAAALLITMYIFDTDFVLLNKVSAGLGGAERGDYLSTESLDARLGLQIRALEVFTGTFPFGVGPGMISTAMNSPIHQTMLGVEFPRVADYSAAIYGQVASGLRKTNCHNTFLEFIAEHGLLGVVALSTFLFLITRNFLLWVKRSRLISQRENYSFFGQACIYAILLGMGVHGLFESTLFPYSMYFMLLYFTFLLPSFKIEPIRVDSSRSKSWQAHPAKL